MEEDLEVLKRQLGRTPRNVVKIEKKCSGGYPQLIATGPILEQEDKLNIFPTTYWLTCPELIYRISQLEEENWIEKIEQKIEQNSKLADRLAKAHKKYAQDRLSLISCDKLKEIELNNPGQAEVLKKSGVGGIVNFAGIKCLHTHYAHYLVDRINPIGQIVADLLAKKFGDLNVEACVKKCRLEG